MEPDAAGATEALGQSETDVTPETAETSDIDLAFAALGAELKGLLGLPVEKRVNTEPQRADLMERNAQLTAELATVRATAERAIAEYASLAERLAAIAEARRPWWRRLVG
jgi:hypothetical protein